MGSVRFGAPTEIIVWLQRQFAITTFIETGTNRGETAAWASTVFDHVVTIEGSESLHRAAARRFTDRTNIRFLHGDSRTCLRDVVGEIPGPAIFWLDAHWCGEETFGASDQCPVLDEIEVIRKSCHDPFILIDDARLFLAPPPPPLVAHQWPDLLALSRALSDGFADGHVVVFEDVLIRIPVSGKAQLVEFIRAALAREAQRPPGPRRLLRLRRLIRRLARR